MRVVLLSRRPTERHYSIELLFDGIFSQLKTLSKDIQMHQVPVPTSGWRSVIQNIGWSRRLKYDIVHVTGDIHYVLLGLIGKKTILTVHDCVTVRGKMNPIKRWIYKKLWFDLPVKIADRITVISEQTKSELIALTGVAESKVLVIPNCVGSDFLPSVFTFNHRKPRILQIGTKPNKNLNRVIEALSDFSCQLVIVGGLSESLIHQLNEAHVDFEQHTGLSREQIVEQYRLADLVIFATTYEGFGLPILEGQAMGRPVITSDLEPMKSVAGQGSCLVDPYSVQSIRLAIDRMIKNDQYREQVIANGFENVKKYQVSKVAEQYLNVYHELMKA